MAFRAIALRASSSKMSSTSSMSKNFLYCFTKALRGSSRIRTKACSSSASRATTMGKRPINSGIKPYFKRSSGITCRRSSPICLSSLGWISAPKPMVFFPVRLSIILSKPSKAPPQINKMLVVSICINSWWGCLRPPWGGTLATVPSRIFKSACCTPSPETSRVIEGFSDLRAILSTSSM